MMRVMRTIVMGLTAAMAVARARAQPPGQAPAQPPAGDASTHVERFITMGDGTRIEVLDWGGTGDAVMFVHGFGLNAHIWDDIAPRLTNEHRVLAMTVRGWAPSDAPERGYTYATVASDIMTVLDSLHIRRVSLIGHSFGGKIISTAAQRYRGRVRSLVYIDAAIQDHARDSVFALRPFSRPAFAMPPGDSTLATYRVAWREYASRYLFGTWTGALQADLDAELASVADHSNGRRDSLVKRYGVDDPADRRQTDFTLITQSALSICAMATPKTLYPWLTQDSARWSPARDYVVTILRPFEHAECDAFEETAPHHRTVRLDGSHYLFITRESDVVEAIREFLR
jgi:pimeloyl-ACP methyl ester carboxylesterase